MTKPDQDRAEPSTTAGRPHDDRRAAALRENLKRRKAPRRLPATPADDVTPDPAEDPPRP